MLGAQRHTAHATARCFPMTATVFAKPMHLERLLQSQGFGTRKECRTLIRSERVSIAGTPCDDPFAEFAADENFAFEVDGEIWLYREKAYVLLNKPVGYECSRSPKHHPSILSLLPPQLEKRGMQPVGRLDEDTSGALLLSDDGQFIHHLTSPRREIAKTYEVTTKHALNADQQNALLGGVQLHDSNDLAQAIACTTLSERCMHMTITEGRYHQVKRMVAASGNRVEALRRIQIGGLVLPDELETGKWRWLTKTDLASLGYPTRPSPLCT